MIWLKYLLIAVICYFLGNISTGLLIGKLTAQIDIRQHGSGNAGTTNVMRTLGWVPSLLTLAGDVLKAVLAVVIGRAIAGEIGWSRMAEGDGNATYRSRIIDAIYNMDGETLNGGAKYEVR